MNFYHTKKIIITLKKKKIKFKKFPIPGNFSPKY